MCRRMTRKSNSVAVPQPFDFKLQNKTKDAKTVGRWFLRPVIATEEDLAAERWKFTFRHPEVPRSSRQDGEGYEAASRAVVASLLDLAERLVSRWEDQFQALRNVQGCPSNQLLHIPQFRPIKVGALRSRIIGKWTKERTAFERLHQQVLDTLAEAGWPVVGTPSWPWPSLP